MTLELAGGLLFPEPQLFYRRVPVGFRGTLRAAPGLPQLVGQRPDAVFVEMLGVQKCLPGMLQGTSGVLMPRLVILFVQGRGSCAMRMGGLLVHLGRALMTLMLCSGISMGHGCSCPSTFVPIARSSGSGGGSAAPPLAPVGRSTIFGQPALQSGLPASITRVSMSSVLTINAGSSTIKFVSYGAAAEPEKRLLHGKVDRVGLSGAHLTFEDSVRCQSSASGIESSDPALVSRFLIDWLDSRNAFDSVKAVGHRVVHGMNHSHPVRITPAFLDELRQNHAYDPEHLPRELQLIDAIRQRHPALEQIACFDTAFHATMPRVAQLLAIPRRFDAAGLRRYGFHGLSYAYLMDELRRVAGVEAAGGRVILAHLGNGASLAAVQGGKSIDTSMGFTPASGLPMGSRSGDLDPGVACYIMRVGKLTPEQFNHLINHESGLLGISGTSSDMRDLLENQASDVRAAEAVELFCYQTRKWIGAFAATLGGLETLVFSGGIGEKSAEVRARVCRGLQFLGIELDNEANAVDGPVISSAASRVAVRVICTDEELMIAREVRRFLGNEGASC